MSFARSERSILTGIAFLTGLSALTAAQASSGCPCQQGCEEFYCIKTYRNGTQVIGLKALTAGGTNFDVNAWLNIWGGDPNSTSKTATGGKIDLYECSYVDGLCSAGYGCAIPAGDPENGSYSCGDTCFVLFPNADQYYCDVAGHGE
ncbi:MAG: hypothetical protein WBC44_15240 [Planctomycetaceae bacterium]